MGVREAGRGVVGEGLIARFLRGGFGLGRIRRRSALQVRRHWTYGRCHGGEEVEWRDGLKSEQDLCNVNVYLRKYCRGITTRSPSSGDSKKEKKKKVHRELFICTF